MRYLHTMIRVGDLDRSIDFYNHVFGFVELRRGDYPKDKFTNVFMGLPADADANERGGPMLELTYNYGVEGYELGSGYGHIALEVDDMDALAERLRDYGGEFSWGPGKTPDGRKNMAFVKDPDGYAIELIQYA
ncbi:MAG: lactoylglutathione lyase [Gammaproteobacteria bacterium]